MTRLKKVWRVARILVGVLLLVLLIVMGVFYAPDKSLSELRERWSYDNSQFITIDNMPVHYRVNGQGTPLLLIHGTGASLHTWEKWTDILEKDFKVISLDMPAFGLTGPNNDGVYSLEFYAEFLDQFALQMGIDSMYVAGNSLGGAIAWRYATLFPEKVNKLILIDASGYPSKKETPAAFKLAQSPLWSQLLLHFTPKSLFRTSLEDVYFNDELVTDELVDQYYELYLRAGNRQAFIDRVNNFTPTNPELIKSINTPTLILWGKEDRWISVDNAYLFQNDISESKVIVYDSVGHIPMEEIPIKTAKDSRDFLLDN